MSSQSSYIYNLYAGFDIFFFHCTEYFSFQGFIWMPVLVKTVFLMFAIIYEAITHIREKSACVNLKEQRISPFYLGKKTGDTEINLCSLSGGHGC